MPKPLGNWTAHPPSAGCGSGSQNSRLTPRATVSPLLRSGERLTLAVG